MIRRVLSIVTFILATLLSVQMIAQTVTMPRLIRYSGSLEGKSGTVGVTFALYKDQSGGSPLWLETQSVTVNANGHYTALLGNARTEGLPTEVFASNEAQWLGVKPEGQEELPRILLVSVPYALKAGDAQTLGGLPASAFALNQATVINKTAAANVHAVTPSTPVAMDIATSTGTTNQVAKWTNSTTLGNSQLFDNGTSVGVGTTSPQAKLDVNGDAIFRGFSATFGTTLSFGPQFDFTNAATPTAAHWRFGVPGSANATSFFIYDYVSQNAPFTMEKGAGANSLYFQAGGKVGIGTSAPTSKLTVTGPVESTSGGFKFPDGTVLTSAVSPVITTSLTYNGSTTNQILQAVQNQAGVGSFNASGVPSALRGDSTTNTGYAAGVFGSASSYQAPGVAGVNLSNCDPQNLNACNGYGVFGWSVQASHGTGVWGQADATVGDNVGVFGTAAGDTGTGIEGWANNASTGDGVGVYGLSDAPSGTGVWGNARAASGSTVGVYGSVVSTGGIAGLFDAPVNGTILEGRSSSGPTKVFHIDSTGKGFFLGGVQPGSADFAEAVDAIGGVSLYEPGDVMMIDKSGTRRLALATGAYSTRVAGIFSTKPGILGSEHSFDDPRLKEEVPLAIVGIVPCKVSAENGAIHAGDLLVTATRPGYAMKGTNRSRMLGAVVGKALGSLDKGTGTIEVLVSLH